MDVSGERRLPAARHVVWNALSDISTLADSLPPGVTIEDDASGRFELTIPDDESAWRTQATPEAGGGPAQTAWHLAAPAGAERGFGGRAEITMAEDGVFTRLLWRLAADLPDSEQPRVEAAIDHVLTHVGQRAATPAPVAAQGIAGATAAIVNAASSSASVERSPLAASVERSPLAASVERSPLAASVERSPVRVIAASLAAMPRDATVGGAVFVLVVLFVVGIL